MLTVCQALFKMLYIHKAVSPRPKQKETGLERLSNRSRVSMLTEDLGNWVCLVRSHRPKLSP